MGYRRRKTVLDSSKSRLLKYLLFLFLIGGCTAGGYFFIRTYTVLYSRSPSLSSVYHDWEIGSYMNVYQKTADIIDVRPFDGTALALHGFAAYYLFAEQTDLSVGSDYLTDSIVHLRRALYTVRKSDMPKVAYMLGKAYYQQGYYYSDLAVKYLDMAKSGGLEAADLAEFRGMAASLFGDADKALEAFTDALADDPSDLVLYAVAENYAKKGDIKNAQLYLFETVKKTSDAVLELRCRNKLAFLFLEEGNTAEAAEQFTAVLEKDANSADAHYGLGLLHEVQGDIIKARYEWRKALRINPLHTETRAKLNIK
ncbi:MAG: tetratricopeptide repeat protein [Treponema sp.]